jgi:hypothetical protein
MITDGKDPDTKRHRTRSSAYLPRWRGRWRRSGIISSFVVVISLVAAMPASAHEASESGYVHRTGDAECTWARAEFDHDDSDGYGGYARSDVAYDDALVTPVGTYACSEEKTALTGYLATRFYVYKWNGSDWYVCAYTNFYYNPRPLHRYYIYSGWSKPPCGRGYYGNLTGSFLKNSGTWKGGQIWSGNHLT